MDRVEHYDGKVVNLCRDGDEWFARIDLWHFETRRHGNAEAAFSEARRHIRARAREDAAPARRF